MENLCRYDIVDIDVAKSLSRSYAGMVLATGDNNANKYGVNIYKDGKPLDVTGYGVLGYFIRPDLNTLIIKGKAEGNTAYVELPAACYTADGSFSLAIKVSGEDITQTVRVVDGCIRLTQTGELVDPGETIPSLDDIFAQMAAMEAATDAANQAAADAQTAIAEATEEAYMGIGKITRNAQSAIELVQSDATAAIATAEAAAAQAVNGNAPPIVQTAQGAYIEADDAAQGRAFPLLSAFGRSTQSAAPTPDSPAAIESVGDNGSITMNVHGENLLPGGSVTVATPDGLCSIPVSTDGSYTDATGQQWLADEIDLMRGVHIQRIGKVVLDGVNAGRMAASKSSNPKVNTYNVSTDDWNRASGADVVLVLSHYPYKGTTSGSSGVTKDGVVMLCNVPGSMYVGHSSIATLDDYNAWLAAQHAAGTPVTVLYPLAEPVETPLTGESLAAAAKLRSLYPVTTITAEGAWIAAQYVADTKTYIDNRFAELAAQLIEA